MSIYALTWITYIVTGAIYMAILYTYFASVFDMRYGTLPTVVVYALVYTADMFFMYLHNGIANIIVSILALTFLIHLYLGNLKTRISIAAFIYLASFLADFLTAYATVLAENISVEQIEFGTLEFLYGLLASKILLAIFAKVLSNIIKQRRLPKLSTLHWIALIITPSGSIFILHNFLVLHEHATPHAFDIISSVIVVIINFIVINVYDKILADYEANVRNKLLEEQVKYFSYQNFLAEASEGLIRKTRHDIKNLLVGFRADIQNNKLDNLENRITEILGEINVLEGPAKSGNIAIDSIVNFKANMARKHQVHFSLNLKIPKNLNVDSSMICLILGNALDNAIEATEKIKCASKKIVQIYMSYKQETLFLQIVNPYDGKVITKRGGRILSSKRGFIEEGIGLQSIRNTLHNNDGDIDITHDNNEFCVSIALYGIKSVKPINAS